MPTSVIKRWTINLLPDAETTAILVAYPDDPMFDDVVRGYRAGSGHGTKEFSYPHVTSVHFECIEEDFEAITESVSEWIAKNPGIITSKLLADSVAKPVLMGIGVGFDSYYTKPSDSDVPTCWVDFNLSKDPFMPLHRAIVGFINDRSAKQGYKIEIKNGVLDKHRPHFTAMRADAAKASAIEFPATPLAADRVISFVVSAGPSPKSGEYHEPKYLFTPTGEKVPFVTAEQKGPELLTLGYSSATRAPLSQIASSSTSAAAATPATAKSPTKPTLTAG